jgi:two-component system sensor histidine kinase ChvG
MSDSTRTVTLVRTPGIAAQFMINGDDGRLGQVVTNLVDNAVSFSPENGAVTMRVRREAGHVVITVDDEGPGIPEDRLGIIFDRFYTDRPLTESTRGKNSGLGLSISREIVRVHGGEIWAENRVETGPDGKRRIAGARFVVRLPALASQTRGGPVARRGS